MPEENFKNDKYDVFLSHAGEDGDWCEKLANLLRDQAVRVWFDRWELKPGHHLLARINQGLKESRKMVSVWSRSYFRDDKVWTLAEGFANQHGDLLAQQRLLIPVLIEDCDILPTFRNILFIDFRNTDDFSLRFQQLLEALDLPGKESYGEPEPEFPAFEPDLTRRDRTARGRGKSFEEEVAALYRLLGFEVMQNVHVAGMQIDMMIEQRVGGLPLRAIVECKDKPIDANDRNQILAQQNLVQKRLPDCLWIAVCSQTFAAASRTALECACVTCVTYPELLRELVPMDRYVEGLIREYESRIEEQWKGQDWFIRPDLCTDVVYQRMPALESFMRWLRDDRSNFLTVLGDLGTGKTTLLSFLAYNMARSFLDDPLRHPAPVLIPLKEVRKELSLEGIIISHFSRRGMDGISFPRFAHLVRNGKVILLFDAFDEMADRVRWEVTRSNFRELRRAADQGGKVVLSCRTHYFKDRNEQAKLIGQGPKLSEIETDLYREVRQQNNAQVVYLQEFNDDQIRDYLKKARPDTHDEDWEKISSIYNLQDLAHRPLLLDMIVKTLPRLHEGQSINAANLYTVYTNLWVDREEEKQRILDRDIKFRLMLELARRLWEKEESSIHYRELTPFVEKLSAGKIMDFDDEEAEDVAREMQGATFLIRDGDGNFSFVHHSFQEYFLARRLLEGLKRTGSPAGTVLDTRRLDRKVIYFLTQLDEMDEMLAPLQEILHGPYRRRFSENSLQILYWSGRIRCGMEERIDDPAKLRQVMATRLPRGANLQKAALEEIVLEGAVLPDALMAGADLTGANLNRAAFPDADFRGAVLIGARCRQAIFSGCDLREANLHKGEFDGADFSEAMMEGAVRTHASLLNAILPGMKMVASVEVGPFAVEGAGTVLTVRTKLLPVIQLGESSAVRTASFSPDGRLLACGGSDGVIRLWRIEDGRLIRTLEGHRGGFFPYRSPPMSPSLQAEVRIRPFSSGSLPRERAFAP